MKGGGAGSGGSSGPLEAPLDPPLLYVMSCRCNAVIICCFKILDMHRSR